MKEVSQYVSNTLATVVDGKLEPQAEIGLILSEPGYRVVGESQVVRERVLETVRFAASPETLRMLAKKFNQTADDTEADFAKALRLRLNPEK